MASYIFDSFLYYFIPIILNNAEINLNLTLVDSAFKFNKI